MIPSDKLTVPEKSAQRYVFLGGCNDADPVSQSHSGTCEGVQITVRPYAKATSKVARALQRRESQQYEHIGDSS